MPHFLGVFERYQEFYVHFWEQVMSQYLPFPSTKTTTRWVILICSKEWTLCLMSCVILDSYQWPFSFWETKMFQKSHSWLYLWFLATKSPGRWIISYWLPTTKYMHNSPGNLERYQSFYGNFSFGGKACPKPYIWLNLAIAMLPATKLEYMYSSRKQNIMLLFLYQEFSDSMVAWVFLVCKGICPHRTHIRS